MDGGYQVGSNQSQQLDAQRANPADAAQSYDAKSLTGQPEIVSTDTSGLGFDPSAMERLQQPTPMGKSDPSLLGSEKIAPQGNSPIQTVPQQGPDATPYLLKEAGKEAKFTFTELARSALGGNAEARDDFSMALTGKMSEQLTSVEQDALHSVIVDLAQGEVSPRYVTAKTGEVGSSPVDTPAFSETASDTADSSGPKGAEGSVNADPGRQARLTEDMFASGAQAKPAPDTQTGMTKMAGQNPTAAHSSGPQTANKNILPEGITGAFVKGENGGQGTALIHKDLIGTPNLAGTVREEFGQAIRAHAEDIGVPIAEGDAGQRLATIGKGEDLAARPELFEAQGTGTTTVSLNGKTVEARAEDEVVGIDADNVIENPIEDIDEVPIEDHNYSRARAETLVAGAFLSAAYEEVNGRQAAQENLIDAAAWYADGELIIRPERWDDQRLSNVVDTVVANAPSKADIPSELRYKLGMSYKDQGNLKTLHTGGRELTSENAKASGYFLSFSADQKLNFKTDLSDQAVQESVSPGSIFADSGVWPQVDEESTVSPLYQNEEVYSSLQTPNLLDAWDIDNPYTEVSSHRGRFNHGASVSENSLSAIEATLADGNMSSLEIDVTSTSDRTLVASHDQTPARITLLDDGLATPEAVKFNKLETSDVVGLPLVERQVDPATGKFTDEYVVTEDSLATMGTSIEYALKINPDATIFIDARNSDAAMAIAQLSQMPDIAPNVAVKTYPYTYENGGPDLIAGVESELDRMGLDPSKVNWKSMIDVHPVLIPSVIQQRAESLNYQTLVNASEEWLESFELAGLSVRSKEIPIESIGEYYNKFTGRVETSSDRPGSKLPDLTADEVAEINASAELQQKFLLDSVQIGVFDLIGLSAEVPIMQSYRSDDFQLPNDDYYIWDSFTGTANIVDEGLAGLGRDYRATPGMLSEYGDILLSDRPMTEKASHADDAAGDLVTETRQYDPNDLGYVAA